MADPAGETREDWRPPDLREEWPLWDRLEALWGGPPPSLPGAWTDGETFPARGAAGGPHYTVNTITPADSLAVRLAYMPHPVSDTEAAALVQSLMPTSGGVRWYYEMAALSTVAGGRPASALIRESALHPFRAGLVPAGDDTLGAVWGRWQALARAVLWTWGGAYRRAPTLTFADTLAAGVGQLREATTRLVPGEGLQAAFARDARRVLLWDLAAAKRHHSQGRAMWETERRPLSLAQLADDLHRIIGSAGTTLAVCPYCGRLFERGRAGQVFCSRRCQNLDGQDKRRGAGKIIVSATEIPGK